MINLRVHGVINVAGEKTNKAPIHKFIEFVSALCFCFCQIMINFNFSGLEMLFKLNYLRCSAVSWNYMLLFVSGRER